MKSKDIAAIRNAAEALRAAIRSEVGPPQLPRNEDILCDAIDAIIEAVRMEIGVDIVRHDPPRRSSTRN